MRHSLLLLALLAEPAHAELDERNPTETHSLTLLNASQAPSSDLFKQALCWQSSNATGKHSGGDIENCLAMATPNHLSNRQNYNEIDYDRSVNWSVINYPAISSGAWSFIPDIGYQLLLEKAADEHPSMQIGVAAGDRSLSSMPLATLTWFVLGCILGTLAMIRRRRAKPAIATD